MWQWRAELIEAYGCNHIVKVFGVAKICSFWLLYYNFLKLTTLQCIDSYFIVKGVEVF